MDWINMEIGSSLLMAILHSFWQGLIIMSILFALTKSKMIKSSQQLYALHLSGLILLFVCFLGTFNYYSNNIYSNAVYDGVLSTVTTSTVTSIADDTSFQFPWRSMIVLTWIAGVLFSLVRFSISGFSVYRLKHSSVLASIEWQEHLILLKQKLGIKANVQIHYSLEAVVPMVVGIFKPVIIVPLIYFNQMSTEELESILIHELVHIKRNDFLFNMVQRVIESFIFFNPATWWMSHQISRYREFYCDDQVQINLETNKSYLKALYKVACHSHKYELASVSLISRKSELTMRVKRILRISNERVNFKPMISVLLLSLIALMFFSFQLESTERSEQSPKLQTEDSRYITQEEVSKSNALSAESAESMKECIDKINQYIRNENSVDPYDLETTFAKIAALKPEFTLALIPDEGLQNKYVVDVLHVAERHNIKVVLSESRSKDIYKLINDFTEKQEKGAKPLKAKKEPKATKSSKEPKTTKPSIATKLIKAAKKSKPLKAQKPPKGMLGLINEFSAKDTLPTSPRIQELEKEMEQKSLELEELTEKLTQEMDGSMEADIQRMEELAVKFEEAIEPRLEAFEKSVDEKEMKKLEELSKKLEEKMSKIDMQIDHEAMEELIESEVQLQEEIKELERQSASKANESAIAAKKAQISELSQKVKMEKERFKLIRKNVMEDAEIEQLQQEIKTITRKMRKNGVSESDIWTDETKALQKEMNAIQSKISSKMKSLDKGNKAKIHVKARELEALVRELELERKKLEKK